MAGLMVKGILGKYGKQYAGDAGGGNGGGLFSRLGKSSGGLFSRFGSGSGGGVNAVGSANTVGSGGGANAGPTLTNRIKAYKPTKTHIGISIAVAVIVVVLIIVLAVVLTRGSGSSTTTPAPLTPLAQMTMASLPTTPAMTLPSVTVPASTVLPSISPTTLAPTPGVAMAPQTAAVQSQTINVSPSTTSEPFPVNMFQVTSGRSAAWQGPSIPITAGQPYTIQTSVFLWNNATSSIDTTTPFTVTLAYTPPGGSVQYTWLMPNQKSGLITIAGSCPASSSQPIIYIDTVPIGIDSIVSQYNNNNTSSTSPWVPSGCQLGPISSAMATAIQTWASQNNIR